jgi:hypothetical protein
LRLKETKCSAHQGQREDLYIVGESMKHLALILLFILSAGLSAAAQNGRPLDHPGCKSYFMTFWADLHIPGGVVRHWEKGQEKWYMETGWKKYPTVCEDAKKATYLLVYTTQERAVKISQLQRLNGGKRSNSGKAMAEEYGDSSEADAAANTPGADVPAQKGVRRSRVYMYIFTTGSTPFFSGGVVQKRPLEAYVERRHKRPLNYVVGGYAGYTDAARDAFEDSISYLASAAPK